MPKQEKTFHQMTLEPFNKEINQALEDSKNDRLISVSGLKAKIKTWGLDPSKLKK